MGSSPPAPSPAYKDGLRVGRCLLAGLGLAITAGYIGSECFSFVVGICNIISAFLAVPSRSSTPKGS